MKRNIISTTRLAYKIAKITVTVCWCFFLAFGVWDFGVKKFAYPLKYKDEVFEIADYYELDRSLVYSVIKCESSFNRKAVSEKGAKGLMQITDGTAQYIALLMGVEEYDLFSARENINFGCFYLKYLLDKFKNVDTAISAYNAGEGNVALWLKNPSYSKDGIRLEAIPFPETEQYLIKIRKTILKYKKLYGNLLDKR